MSLTDEMTTLVRAAVAQRKWILVFDKQGRSCGAFSPVMADLMGEDALIDLLVRNERGVRFVVQDSDGLNDLQLRMKPDPS